MPIAFSLPIILILSAADAGLAPSGAEPLSDEPCETMMVNLSSAAEGRGYAVSLAASGLTGIDAALNVIEAQCEPRRAGITLVASDGSTVSIDLALGAIVGSGSLEVAGDFAGTGVLTRTAVLTGFRDDAVNGFLTVTAAAGAQFAVVEHDFAADRWIASGDAAALSSTLAPVLSASKIWRDGHIFAFTASGTWNRFKDEIGGGAADAALAVLCDTALPALDIRRMSEADKTTFKACLAAAGSCGLALLLKFGFGSGTACFAGGSACFAAAACSYDDDCSKDAETRS